MLVVIQLDGGNDGINTVVPYTDEGYARNRNLLRIPTDRLIKIDSQVGLHPAMRGAADLLEQSKLAILQGVGYPNPDRSHDVSMSIWQTANLDREEHNTFGWIGRAMDKASPPSAGGPSAVLLGTENSPVAIRGRRSTTDALAGLENLRLNDAGLIGKTTASGAESDDIEGFLGRSTLDAYATSKLLDRIAAKTDRSASYPSTKLALRMQSISQLIKADFGTRVYYAVHSGFDTHIEQLPSHAGLLRDFSGALKAFLDDLAMAKLDDRVLVLAFSEFGRRVEENASHGTDHGTAGPVFIAGNLAKAGLVGKPSSLTDLVDGDLRMQFDFRQIYAPLLDKWLAIDAEAVLGAKFEPLPIL